MMMKPLNTHFLLIYITAIGFVLGLEPVLDKKEIGEGETFTVTCDAFRATDSRFNTIHALEVFKGHKKMMGVYYGVFCKPCLHNEYKIEPPWEVILTTPEVPIESEVQIKFVNSNSSCNDAGNFYCEYFRSSKEIAIEAKGVLRKKASCNRTTTAIPTTRSQSTKATEPTYKCVNCKQSTAPHIDSSTLGSGTKATEPTYKCVNCKQSTFPHIDPSTLGSGFQVNGRGKILYVMALFVLIVASQF